MRMRAIAGGLLCLLAQSGWAASGCSDLSSIPVRPNVQWNQVWEALDNESSCTQNCHLGSNPVGDLDLANRNLAIYFLVGQASSQDTDVQRVEPGDPLRSLFYQKIACEHPDVGTPMPPGGLVPLELKALVWDWIAQGAYGESEEDPIPREFVLELPRGTDACVPDQLNGHYRTASLQCLLAPDRPLDP